MIPCNFLRHAQSEGNIGLNKKNPNLTSFGYSQAKEVAGEYDLVICSTLARAQQTLSSSRIQYRSLILSDLCREFRQGHVSEYFDYEDEKPESYSELKQRIEELKDLIRSKFNPNCTRILVISHAFFICHFCEIYRGIYNCELIKTKIPII